MKILCKFTFISATLTWYICIVHLYNPYKLNLVSITPNQFMRKDDMWCCLTEAFFSYLSYLAAVTYMQIWNDWNLFQPNVMWYLLSLYKFFVFERFTVLLIYWRGSNTSFSLVDLTITMNPLYCLLGEFESIKFYSTC